MVGVIHMLMLPTGRRSESVGAAYLVSGDRIDSGFQVGIFPHIHHDRGASHALSFSLNMLGQDSRQPLTRFFTSFDPDKSRVSR